MTELETRQGQRWKVSALASVAWREGMMELSVAGAPVKLAFDGVDAMLVLHAFAKSLTVEEVLARFGQWPSAPVVACVSELIDAGVLVPDEENAVAEWDSYALAFHHSTRAASLLPAPAPAVEATAAQTASRVQLSPVTEPVTGLPLLLSQRKSTRAWRCRAVSMLELSRLLWLSTGNRHPGPDVSRPYPSGGGVYSLEFYVVTGEGAVSGLPAGVYRYQPSSHELEVVSADPAHPPAFLDAAAQSAGSQRPPIVLVLTSRYAEQATRYGTLAYSLILKEVGAVFQTLYLVAAHVGLAGCALGAGTPEQLLAQLSGVDEYTEPVVGEFMLGPI